MAQNELVFAPLGGIGEIGMNLSIYGFGDGPRRKWLIVDCGVSFGSEEYLPGVDLILPDIRFLIEERRNVVGLVLTHAHEDHMGALIDLWPKLNVPLYACLKLTLLERYSGACDNLMPRPPVSLDIHIPVLTFIYQVLYNHSNCFRRSRVACLNGAAKNKRDPEGFKEARSDR